MFFSFQLNDQRFDIQNTINTSNHHILQEMSLVLGVGGSLAAKAAGTSASGKLASWNLSSVTVVALQEVLRSSLGIWDTCTLLRYSPFCEWFELILAHIYTISWKLREFKIFATQNQSTHPECLPRIGVLNRAPCPLFESFQKYT